MELCNRHFLGLSSPLSDRGRARYAVLPIPYEATVSYGKGASRGPAAVIEASIQVEYLDQEVLLDVTAPGIHTADPVAPGDADPRAYIDKVHAAAADLLADGKYLLGLGGEHSITTGLVRAVLDAAGDGPIGVLQVDAHGDLRDSFRGTRWSHGCVMRRLHEDLGLPISSVGIRSFCEEEHRYMRARNIEPITPAMVEDDPDGWIERALAKLPGRIYLTVDIDGFDPGSAPGTGTPEPGGLTWRQVTGLMRAAFERKQVLAADVVEVAPIVGQQVTEFLAARVLCKMIAYREAAAASR